MSNGMKSASCKCMNLIKLCFSDEMMMIHYHNLHKQSIIKISNLISTLCFPHFRAIPTQGNRAELTLTCLHHNNFGIDEVRNVDEYILSSVDRTCVL